jgi:hypothetical protein
MEFVPQRREGVNDALLVYLVLSGPVVIAQFFD